MIRARDTLEGRFDWKLAAERLMARYRKGAPLRQWERRPERCAESRGGMVYGVAARTLVNAKVERREEEIASKALPKPPPTVVKSAWLHGA